MFNEYCDVKPLQDRHTSVQMMQYYLNELDLDISKLKFVHVTGSKGKGTTCSYVDSALRKHGLKTGLFTSPHIQDLCERFRINGKKITRDVYLQHFHVVWDKLQEIKARMVRVRFPYLAEPARLHCKLARFLPFSDADRLPLFPFGTSGRSHLGGGDGRSTRLHERD